MQYKKERPKLTKLLDQQEKGSDFKSEEQIQNKQSALAKLDGRQRILDAEQKRICELRFWSNNYHNWESIGEMLYYSTKTIYNKRYKLLFLLAVEKWLIKDSDACH